MRIYIKYTLFTNFGNDKSISCIPFMWFIISHAKKSGSQFANRRIKYSKLNYFTSARSSPLIIRLLGSK